MNKTNRRDLQRLRQICDRHGLLLIFDEVITGFGRLGTAFAAERYGVVPDMITFAKGVNSGTVPMGGVIVRKPIHDAFMKGPEHVIELFHGYTYSAHPLACAAGLATLDVYRQENLFGHAKDLEPLWADAAMSLKDLPNVVDIAPSASPPPSTSHRAPRRSVSGPMRSWSGRSHDIGLMIRITGDTIALSPPLIVSEDQIGEIVDKTAQAIRAGGGLSGAGARPALFTTLRLRRHDHNPFPDGLKRSGMRSGTRATIGGAPRGFSISESGPALVSRLGRAHNRRSINGSKRQELPSMSPSKAFARVIGERRLLRSHSGDRPVLRKARGRSRAWPGRGRGAAPSRWRAGRASASAAGRPTRAAATRIQIDLRCASDSYNFNLTSNVQANGNAIAGSWTETTRNASGSVSGTASGGQIQARVSGPTLRRTLRSPCAGTASPSVSGPQEPS